jgi:replicative superfamily II helicase
VPLLLSCSPARAAAALLLLLQAFHTLFHTDESVLLGAPTGSGKTISSELTMMRLWDAHPGDKVRMTGCRFTLLLAGMPAICSFLDCCKHWAVCYTRTPYCHMHTPSCLATGPCRRCLCCGMWGLQVIYIAPLKALVRERMNDWGKGLCKRLGKRIVELTGVHGGGGGSGGHC